VGAVKTQTAVDDLRGEIEWIKDNAEWEHPDVLVRRLEALVEKYQSSGDEESATDRRFLERVNAADVLILMEDKGQAGFVVFKGIKTPIPWDFDVCYGEEDDPPLTIRQVTVKAGWPAKKWRSMDRSALHELESGEPS
jgi:hypothetical protein